MTIGNFSNQTYIWELNLFVREQKDMLRDNFGPMIKCTIGTNEDKCVT